MGIRIMTLFEERKRVLIVDDTPENICILVEILKDQYDVSVAINGQKALKIAAMNPPIDLILLDIMMPEMDGYEVFARLKANPKTANIPVIFVTALSAYENEAKGLELGAVDYITKPFNSALVRARVKNHLELKNYRDKLEEMVQEKTRELMITRDVAIETLGSLAEYRNLETGNHIKRTMYYVRLLAPSFIHLSMASGVATPSCNIKGTSPLPMAKMRLTTKPGESFTGTGSLPNLRLSSMMAFSVSDETCRGLTTSISFIICTGLKKCMPINLSGRLVTLASSETDSEEVLLASIASGLQISSSCLNRLFFISIFSTIASITTSQSATSLSSELLFILAIIAVLASELSLPFSTALPKILSILLRAFSTNSRLRSFKTTLNPAWAHTWAIPKPIAPAPITPTFLMSKIVYLLSLIKEIQKNSSLA
jgi:CheY-like chemotaxis protein